jgi:hypothetical protein
MVATRSAAARARHGRFDELLVVVDPGEVAGRSSRLIVLFIAGVAASCDVHDTEAVAPPDELPSADDGGTPDADPSDGDGSTGDGGDGAPSDSGEPDGATCPAPMVLSRPGHVFTPTVDEPIYREDISLASGLWLRKVEVDLTFTRGPWADPAPPTGGIHNIFWLHRGLQGNHWLNNNVGYMNIKGLHALDVNNNLGITDPDVWSQNLTINSFPTSEGDRFDVQYVYDAAGNIVSFRVLENGQQIGYREADPLLDVVAAADCWLGAEPTTPGMFLVIGNAAWDGSGGPEVPTYGWDYADLEVRLYPVCE